MEHKFKEGDRVKVTCPEYQEQKDEDTLGTIEYSEPISTKQRSSPQENIRVLFWVVRLDNGGKKFIPEECLELPTKIE